MNKSCRYFLECFTDRVSGVFRWSDWPGKPCSTAYHWLTEIVNTQSEPKPTNTSVCLSVHLGNTLFSVWHQSWPPHVCVYLGSGHLRTTVSSLSHSQCKPAVDLVCRRSRKHPVLKHVTLTQQHVGVKVMKSKSEFSTDKHFQVTGILFFTPITSPRLSRNGNQKYIHSWLMNQTCSTKAKWY